MIYGGLFDTDQKIKDIKMLEEQMNQADFWEDKEASDAVIGSLSLLKKQTTDLAQSKKKIEDLADMIELLDMEYDEEIENMIINDLSLLEENIESLSELLLLDGEFDQENAILEIHSGAGGTESCDWASMLFRMYTRWCEKKSFKVEILDQQDGLDAGIKSVTLIVKGINAYGYLKHEKGIHRLVRLSPFDSANRRHTSFASVEVTPYVNKEIELNIDPKDLKIDVYRSSGAGGQGVNTTDSAVRITHLPTKTVVTCQNERSQLQNKEQAMKILKNKLYVLEEEKKNEEIKQLQGERQNIEFGSQIRSYVMHPYSMVKDHRTNIETSNVSKVMDGDIDMFIKESLKRN